MEHGQIYFEERQNLTPMTFILQNILEMMTMLIFWVNYAFKGGLFWLGPVSNHLACHSNVNADWNFILDEISHACHLCDLLVKSSHIYLYTEFYTIKKQRHSNKQENSVDETN